MRKPYIVIARRYVEFDGNFNMLLKHGQHGCKYESEFKILKVRPKRPNIKKTGGLANIDLDIQFKADFVYDTECGTFLKNRAGPNGLNGGLNSLPQSLQRFMKPVSDIIHKTDNGVNYLFEKYKKMDLLEAVFLTDTFDQFIDYDYMLDYQLVRLKYGKPISDCYKRELVAKYPEKLI